MKAKVSRIVFVSVTIILGKTAAAADPIMCLLVPDVCVAQLRTGFEMLNTKYRDEAAARTREYIAKSERMDRARRDRESKIRECRQDRLKKIEAGDREAAYVNCKMLFRGGGDGIGIVPINLVTSQPMAPGENSTNGVRQSSVNTASPRNPISELSGSSSSTRGTALSAAVGR